MAAESSPTLYAHLMVRHSPDLCTTCWLPALWTASLITLTPDGVDETTSTFCDNCGTRR